MRLIWLKVIGTTAGWGKREDHESSWIRPRMNLLLGVVGGLSADGSLHALGFPTTGGFIPSV